jgi:DNA polymerase III delta prime subunit
MELTLVEKYRQYQFDQMVGLEWIIKILKRLIENNALQSMFFFGPPGCGKTTLAYVLASEYFGKKISLQSDYKEYTEINGSNERGIETVRGWIKQFSMSRSLTRNSKGELLKKIMVIDEIDNTTIDFQRAFRVVMEKAQDNCVFIGIGNHKEGIKERALFSRSMTFEFDPQPPESLGIYFERVAKAEGIEFQSKQIVRDVITHPEYKGDFRRIINDTLQKLIGIDHKVTKEDLPWIYRNSYLGLIEQMIKEKQYVDPFFSVYKEKAVNCVMFIQQLAKQNQKLSFQLAKVFADTEFRLKNGGDELIQMTYLLTACEELK